MSAPPAVSLVVVNWNGRDLLAECLPSLAALDYPAERTEAIVVDNGSHDGSVAWIGQAWPAVRVLANERNLGFAAACNRGAEAAAGELLAFVNSDVRLAPGWLRTLLDACAATGAAAAGSRILDWTGARIDFDGALMNFHGHGAQRRHGRPHRPDPPAPPPHDALFACGAAMIVERARFLASGGFDSDYFAYFEDVDLGWRLWLEGARVVHVPAAVAFHRHHGSGMPAGERARLLERNALANVVKNYDDASLARVLPAALALLDARARLASPEAAAAARRARSDFPRAEPLWRDRRAAVQARRRRPDHEIVPLFGEPFRPSLLGRAYWHEQGRVVREFEVGRIFGDTAAPAMDDFIEQLEARIEALEAELAEARRSAEAASADRAALTAEIARLEAERGGARRSLWARWRAGRTSE